MGRDNFDAELNLIIEIAVFTDTAISIISIITWIQKNIIPRLVKKHKWIK